MTYERYLQGLGGGNSSYFDAADYNANAGNNYYKGADGSYTNDMGNTMNTGGGFNAGTALQGVQALSGLASAYTGLKGLGLAEDQFGFQKDTVNRNIANQAALINENRMKSADVGLALAGSTMSDAQKTATRNKITSGNVDGSKIG